MMDEAVDWSKLKPYQLLKRSTSASYARGQDYFASGAVQGLRLRNGVYTARVQGSELYSVEVGGEPGAVEVSCSCPYEGSGLCKHGVAVLLGILELRRKLEPARPIEEALPVGRLVEELSAERLRRFLLQEIAEMPRLEEDLRIFLQGSAESGRSVEDYKAGILRELEAAKLGGDVDLAEPVLAPCRDKARKFLAQSNQGEAAKIHEAILRACGEFAGDDFEFKGQVARTLEDWGAALASTPADFAARERLARLFAENPYGFSEAPWARAIGRAIPTAEAARRFLEAAAGRGSAGIELDPDRAEALANVYRLAGDLESAILLGRKIAPRLPRHALALAEALAGLGQDSEAVAVLEAGLRAGDPGRAWKWRELPTEAMLRLLLKLLDPRSARAKRVARARELALLTGDEADYELLREAVGPADEGRVLAEVLSRLPVSTAIRILAREERWPELLDSACKHLHSEEFPLLFEALRERYPAECFELCRELLAGLLGGIPARGGGQDEEKAVRLLLEMRGIPGHSEALLELVAEVLSRCRQPRLEKDLGELGRQGRERLERERRELLRGGGRPLEELLRLCPIDEKDRAVVEEAGAAWSLPSAALVWAVLVRNGGRLAASTISEAIARHKGIPPEKANPIRSGGLRILEILGYAKVERAGARLVEARLLPRS